MNRHGVGLGVGLELGGEAGTPNRPDWTPGWPPGQPPYAPPGQPPGPAESPLATQPGGGWLAERLYEHRLVLVHGPLDRATATRVTAEVLSLDATASHRIRIHLASPGGDLGAALALTDTLDLLRVSVHIIAVGEVGSPALALLTATDRALAHPHARFHLSEPRFEIAGRADEVATLAEHHAAMMRTFVGRLAESTGKSAEEIADDLRAGRFLAAGEAVDYGLVDSVVSPDSAPL